MISAVVAPASGDVVLTTGAILNFALAPGPGEMMFKSKFTAVKAALGSAVLAAGAVAHAALPAGAETAITDYGTDVKSAIGLVIAAGIGIYALRKLGQKMGWL